MTQTLEERYKEEIVPLLKKELGIANDLAVPRIGKIIVSIGLGEAILNSQAMDKATDDLRLISAQHPVVTKAKKSIASFKLRKGMKIGLKVTLRRKKMYSFFERLVQIALPRVRDFRGVSRKSFDGKGNYNLGLREQIVFPEIKYDNIDRIRGLQITIVTNARTDKEAATLLEKMGMPFSK